MDVAKGMGILLVFYGHYVEGYFKFLPGEPTGPAAISMAAQWKLIYSFHMPLFFALSGAVHREWTGSLRELVQRQLSTRYGPALFYGALGVSLSLASEILYGDPVLKPALWDVIRLAYFLLVGDHVQPLIIVTWFLICLSTLELILYAWYRAGVKWPILSDKKSQWLFSLAAPLIGLVMMHMGVKNFQYMITALLCVPFLMVGRAFQFINMTALSRARLTLFFLAGFAVVILTYDANGWNNGPLHFLNAQSHAVILNANRVGNPGLFFLTAAAGTLAMMALSVLLARSAPLAAVGRRSLHVFCLDGLLLVFVNVPLLDDLLRRFPVLVESPAVATVTAIAIVLVEVAACLALAWAITPGYRLFARGWSGLCRNIVDRTIFSSRARLGN